MRTEPMKIKVKTCSCKMCKSGRHNMRRTIERKARRYWNHQTKKLATQPDAAIMLSHYGGGYTD